MAPSVGVKRIFYQWIQARSWPYGKIDKFLVYFQFFFTKRLILNKFKGVFEILIKFKFTVQFG